MPPKKRAPKKRAPKKRAPPAPTSGVKRNDPTKPTCKAVVQQGQRGMRNNKIHTGKCQVRTLADAAGNVTNYNKQNSKKVKEKNTGDMHFVEVSSPPHTSKIRLKYDTGANTSTMSTALAKTVGILNADGSSAYEFVVQSFTVASSATMTAKMYKNVPLKLHASDEVSRGNVAVGPTLRPLLGTTHIKGYKRHRVKFR